jgi:hypothetical protein
MKSFQSIYNNAKNEFLGFSSSDQNHKLLNSMNIFQSGQDSDFNQAQFHSLRGNAEISPRKIREEVREGAESHQL